MFKAKRKPIMRFTYFVDLKKNIYHIYDVKSMIQLVISGWYYFPHLWYTFDLSKSLSSYLVMFSY